jgi:hypothetical protein
MPKGKSRKRVALAEAQNWRCAYCSGVMEDRGRGPRVATIEHVIPRSRGGTEARLNLVVACHACNTARGPHHTAMRFYRQRRHLREAGLWPEGSYPSRAVAKWMRGIGGATPDLEDVRFTVDEVIAHVAEHHPGCPTPTRDELARLVAQRSWGGASIGMAFGIVATDYVRQAFTDYRRLRQIPGMTGAEARLIVGP